MPLTGFISYCRGVRTQVNENMGMLMAGQNSPEIFEVYRIVLRTTKEDSAFFYFTMESNDNLCFYSTLASSLGKNYRDIEIGVTRPLRPAFDKMLHALKMKMSIEILSEELLPNQIWDPSIKRY